MKRVVVLALVLVAACSRGTTATPDAGAPPPAPGPDGGGFDRVAIDRAEDLRHAKDVGADVRTSHDVAARRRSARALARIGDPAAVEGLLAHLGDEDGETVAWAAYGLGYACKGREDAHVKALAARAASLAPEARPIATASASPKQRAAVDPFVAVARAVGRCGAGTTSEQLLVAWLRAGATWEEPALLGLGDLANKRKQLGAEAMTALVEAVTRKERPAETAFYALARAEPGEAFGRRVIDVAKTALGWPGESRLFAIKALARAGKSAPKDVAPELRRVVEDAKTFSTAERAEASRGLGGLGEAGRDAATEALIHLAPDRNDAVAVQNLLGGEFHVLYTLLGSLGAEPPKKVEATLKVLSNLEGPPSPKPGLAMRLEEIRCAAALGLARGAYDAEVIQKCAPAGEIAERTRLVSLLRRPIEGERKAVFRALAESPNLRVREQAVEAIGEHPELRDLGAQLLASALSSKKAGLVAVAAEVVHTHPERVMVLAESEKRAALDPKAPPPSATPAQEVSKDIGKALGAALDEKWPEDRFETRIALVEAAAAVRHPKAKAVATAACADPNPTVRERAQKTLRELGESVASCNASPRDPEAAAELGKTKDKPVTLVLTTEIGELRVILEPELAPITTTRLASLASTGFFKGITIHRVVPGFVVQLGDPEGDGYGGSGKSLRCETSPVAFAPLDVGMALAGRDTGSSQFFVTLARTPHLDGDYTRVGRAEGDWASVAQGDHVLDAKLVE